MSEFMLEWFAVLGKVQARFPLGPVRYRFELLLAGHSRRVDRAKLAASGFCCRAMQRANEKGRPKAAL